MTGGSNQGLFVVVVIVIFGIFVSLGYLLFGDNLKPTLASIFKDSFENVNNTMGIDSSEDLSGDLYDDWVKDLESKGYVVATDSDFSGTRDGYFKYIGKSKKVIIPKVIKGVTITKTTSMFNNSTPIEAVAMKNPNVTNMSSMFKYNGATSLDLSNLFTENVTDMSYMFSVSQATNLDLSSFDTSKVTNMSNMFASSKAIDLDLSKFNTSNVTNMSSMFHYSPATSLDLSKFNTSNVTDMNNMFAGIEATELNLSNFNTSNVTDMSWMFSSIKATELDLSSFDTSNVTDMSYMFAYSKKITTGYARTLDDATKFNTSSNKPSTLNFVVK